MLQFGARALLAFVQGILKAGRPRGGLCPVLAKQTTGGDFHIFSDVSLALGYECYECGSLSVFSPLLPCGSHVALLNYTGMSQQGLWKEGDVLPVG